MYAEVNSARSLRTPLLYNEQKVEQKHASRLDAQNFWQEKGDLTLHDMQQRFSSLVMLNERSVKKIVHISVNFHPDDKLGDKAMVRIAKEFMKAIDFGEQPALVYRHNDAGHPHMHIVSTNIRPDGSRILNDLRSPHHLMQICSKIEKANNLRAALAPHKELYLPDRGYVPSLTYGKMPTRTGIEMVLTYVLDHYRFTSFESFNAVLGLYNVRADRGNPDGLMYQSRGLYYRMIDSEGKKLGAPIKASDFYLPVTLDKVEQKCRLNQSIVKEATRQSMRSRIDYHLIGCADHLGKFRDSMRRHSLGVIIPALTQRPTRSLAPTDAPGLFYIDFKDMSVFRDTELGKDYIASSILQRCNLHNSIPEWVRQQQPDLKPGERALLNDANLDHAATRNLLLRLSPQHDKFIESQQQQLRQTHRLRHSF